MQKFTAYNAHFFLRIAMRAFLFFVFFIFILPVNAQVFYSTNPKYLLSKSEANNLLMPYRYSYQDTSLTEYSDYFPRNYLGNLGLASPNYLLKHQTPDLGFIFFNPFTENDRFLERDIQYMRSMGPYASLTGIAGAKELQIFKLLFTHTYKDKVNISLKFNRYTSLGFYKRQSAYTNNFFLTSNYETKSKRFGYYLYILNNSNKNNENGGLRRDTLNDFTVLQLKDIQPINITNANRDNREFAAQVNPYFRLNKKSDSTHRLNHFIQLKSKITSNSFQYVDRGIYNDGFYAPGTYDTLITQDSSNVRKFVNDISYAMLHGAGNLGVAFGIKNEITQLWQMQNSLFFNNIAHGDLFFSTKIGLKDSLEDRRKIWETKINVQTVLQGSNAGDRKIDASTQLTINELKRNKVALSFLYESRTPDQIYKSWNSNHFIWQNDLFKPQERLQLKADLSLWSTLNLSVFQQTVKNYLYFDASALAAQYQGTVLNTGATVVLSHVFFKHLGIFLSHTYQTSSKPEYVLIPKNVSTAKLFYTGNLFKNNLQLQIGSQVQVFQSFTPYAYMPATQIFYLQNQVQTAAYPFVDVYLSARIRPVSFFLKLENVLREFAGTNYFLVRGYYQQERAFRFGLTWTFFD